MSCGVRRLHSSHLHANASFPNYRHHLSLPRLLVSQYLIWFDQIETRPFHWDVQKIFDIYAPIYSGPSVRQHSREDSPQQGTQILSNKYP